MLRLDRLRALVDVYPGVDREDEMVAAFDYCLHGKGGAAPSIDTAMHGLVDAPHVDHLHPDSGIALATAADGEKLTEECFGDRVVWVPWRRPGFQLGLDIAAIKEANPQAIGVHPRRARHHRLGGHPRTGRGELAGDHPHRAGVPRRARQRRAVRRRRPGLRAAARGRAPRQGRRDLPDDPRAGLHRQPAGRALHRQRRRAGVPVAGEARARWPSWAPRARTTSCAPRSSRWSSTCPATASVEEILDRLPELHEAYRADYQAYYDRHATPDSPAMRGADPAIVLVPGSGCSPSARTSRPPGWPASSTSTRST